jgi:uncharacterized protein involved in exopolysaccharide biosynthesis
VEQTPDQGKPPPPSSYRGTYRRHRKLFLVPVILGALAGAFFVFTSVPSYKSTASLWVDTAAPLPSTVGVGPTTPLSAPPAAAEQGILTELLTTQSFAASVAKSSALGKTLGNAASIWKTAPTYLEAGQVAATVAGAQILRITYSGSSPEEAQSVLSAVVNQLREYNNNLTAQHAQNSAAYDREQVKLAQAALTAARDNVNSYQQQHPGAGPADPNLLALSAAENNAVTALGTANATLSQATGTSNTGGWTLQVVDPASPGQGSPVGKKKLIELILAGAFGGFVLSFLVIVLLTPAKKEMWEDELPIGTPFASNVPPAEPFHRQSSVAEAVKNGHSTVPTAVGHQDGHSTEPTAAGHQDGRRLSTVERRFIFRRPNEKVED